MIRAGSQGVGLFADWELDLWGRVRSARSASTASYESAVADAEYARQSIAALVAKSYFLATEAGLQLQLAGELVKASQELVALAEQRQKVGNGDGYDAAIARANVETFRDTEEQLKLAREQALRGLEALLGRYPAAEIEAATELAKAPGPVPAGLPSELLERRPDVVAAERRVASAFYGIQEAKAARLPAIKLTGSVNDISSDLFVLKNRDRPGVERGCEPVAARVQRGGVADAGPDPHRAAEAGAGGLRSHRCTRLRRSRRCLVVRNSRPASARRCSPAQWPTTSRHSTSRTCATRSARATCAAYDSSSWRCTDRGRH